jgi:hypothetical protein
MEVDLYVNNRGTTEDDRTLVLRGKWGMSGKFRREWANRSETGWCIRPPNLVRMHQGGVLAAKIGSLGGPITIAVTGR